MNKINLISGLHNNPEIMEDISRQFFDQKENRAKQYEKKLILLHNDQLNCFFEKSIKVWELTNLQTPKHFDTQNGIIKSVIQLKIKTIATGLTDGSIRLWNYDTFIVTSSLIGHYKSVLCLMESDYNHYLVSGSADWSVKIWDLSTKTCLTTLTGHKASISCLLELRDSRLATGSLDTSIFIWSQRRYTFVTKIDNNCGKIHAMIQLTNEKISFSSGKTIQIWSIKEIKHIINLKQSFPEKITVIIRVKSNIIICYSKDTIYLFDVCFNKCLSKYQDPNQNSICSMVLLTKSQIAYISSTPEIILLKLIQNKKLM